MCDASAVSANMAYITGISSVVAALVCESQEGNGGDRRVELELTFLLPSRLSSPRQRARPASE